VLSVRVIPCLDVADGRVVKGVRFADLRDAGDPVELARRYDAEGADELCFLDVRASADRRRTLVQLVARVARELFIPFTVGGGIASLDDIHAVLDAGADKVSIGSAALRDPGLVEAAARAFGSQFVVVSLDVGPAVAGARMLTSHGGRQRSEREVVAFARELAERGAGELLLNDMERDGTRDGFGLALLAEVGAAVPIPVIASGGAGCPADFVAAARAGAAAVLAAGILHDGSVRVAEIKAAMAAAGLPVRSVGPARPLGASTEGR
jgi:cyclase